MSFDHSKWVDFLIARHQREERKPVLAASDVAVLRALVTFINHESDEAWPSVSKLSERSALHERTVRRALTKLERLQYIVISKRSSGAQVYRMPMPTRWRDSIAEWESTVRQRPEPPPLSSEERQLAADAENRALFEGSVPGIDDWRECMRIHTELLADERYGSTPGERIMNAIIRGQHPNWNPGGVAKPLPYDPNSPAVSDPNMPKPSERSRHNEDQ